MVDTMVSHAQDLVQHVVEVKLPPKDVLTLVKNDAASKSLFGVRAVRTARFDTKVKEPLALMRPEPPVIVAPAFTPTVPPPMISVTHPEQLEMVPPELDVTAPPMVLPEQAPPVQQWVGVETAQLIVDEIQNNAVGNFALVDVEVMMAAAVQEMALYPHEDDDAVPGPE